MILRLARRSAWLNWQATGECVRSAELSYSRPGRMHSLFAYSLSSCSWERRRLRGTGKRGAFGQPRRGRDETQWLKGTTRRIAERSECCCPSL